jgi:uncharacterized DUF497 family protein
MRFEWDERKRLLNLEKHGLDFLDVAVVFEAPYVKGAFDLPGRRTEIFSHRDF